MVPTQRDVIIIGAGAAGLMCAAACGKRGRSVLVLDHAGGIGNKIRISGGGRCNFTNRQVTHEHYQSNNPDFCRSAITRFTPDDFIALLKNHRVPFYEKEAGQLFCTGRAEDIVLLLQKECDAAGVDIRTNCRVSAVQKAVPFRVSTNHGVFQSESLVMATGGLSYQKLGATGFGHTVARQFGLSVVEPRPALVPLVLDPRTARLVRSLSGVSLNATVTCGPRSYQGNVLFTHRGLSGPAILQISLAWKRGEHIVLDLLPGVDMLGVFLSKRSRKVQLHTVLSGYLPRRFAELWCAHTIQAKPLNQYSDKELKFIADALHSWRILPETTEGYRIAEVTAGGVDTRGLSSKTMEAIRVPGLYFIGEVVDVTGELGGYNLHWAWASGNAAGQYA
ncbi:MAG TPA: aminoacetone oxidase family FAD-binding enzyme [Nitrospiraceae bacterium]|nr:aminoacetone oxidase family FAD-binding enzyme [Nitrospiraceae bacterium]